MPRIEYRDLAENICRAGLSEFPELWTARRALVARFSWAIPCEKALETLANHSPILELGAGSGYWAFLLRQMGVDVLAYDKKPVGTRRAWHKQGWTPVLRGRANKAKKHPDRTLFLCWPPYQTPFADDALYQYRGQTVIYVGEGPGGYTADFGFHHELEAHWEQTATVDLPQWPGIHDYLSVWRRR